MPAGKPLHDFTVADYEMIQRELQTNGNGEFAAAIGKALKLADIGNANMLARSPELNNMFYYSLERAKALKADEEKERQTKNRVIKDGHHRHTVTKELGFNPESDFTRENGFIPDSE